MRKTSSMAAKITGLAALIASTSCVKLDTSKLPDLDPETGTRPSIVYEGELQMPVDKRPATDGFTSGVYEFAIAPGYKGQPTTDLVELEPSGEGREPPVSMEVSYYKDSQNNITGGRITLEDTDTPFRDGARFYIGLTGATTFGHGFSSPTSTLEFTYVHGLGNGPLTDIVTTQPGNDGDDHHDGNGDGDHHNPPPQEPTLQDLYNATRVDFVNPNRTQATDPVTDYGFIVELQMPVKLEERLTTKYGSAFDNFKWSEKSENTGLGVAGFYQPVTSTGGSAVMPVYQVTPLRTGTRMIDGIEKAIYEVSGNFYHVAGTNSMEVVEPSFAVWNDGITVPPKYAGQATIPFNDSSAVELH